jgi:hypothetical protein
MGNNQATALVMYQPDNSADPSISDEVNKAVQGMRFGLAQRYAEVRKGLNLHLIERYVI